MVLPQATMLKINLIVLRLKLQGVMFLADPSYADFFFFLRKTCLKHLQTAQRECYGAFIMLR